MTDSVNRFVNKHKFDKENNEKLVEIEKTLQQWPKPGRVNEKGRIFYREGTIGKQSPHSSKFQPRKCFVFNDCFVYCKENVVKGTIPMHLVLVRNVKDIPKKLKNGFQIRRIDTNRVFTFSCQSAFEKTEWLKDLKKIVEEHTKNQDASSRVTKNLIQKEWTDEI